MQQRQQLVIHLLPPADDKQIHKRGHRLGVYAGRAAGEDQGQKLRAVRASQGNAGHVQHVQHRGIGHLIADGEGHGVKFTHAVAAFQGVEGQTGLFHLLMHVPPGGEHPLTPHIVQAVHGVI